MHHRKLAGCRAGQRLLLAAFIAVAAFAIATSTSERRPAAAEERGHEDEFVLHLERDGREYRVVIALLLLGGAGGREASLAAERARILSDFPGAILDEDAPGTATAQFVRYPYRWPGTSVGVGYNPAGKPPGLGGDEAAIRAGAVSWNGVGAAIAFRDLQPSSAGLGGCHNAPDGQNVVGWARAEGGVLARTCTWYDSGGLAIEFDIEVSQGFAWTTSDVPNVDLQSVVAHELGHALGLNHSPDGSALMFDTYMITTMKRYPQPDDIAGLTAIYGRSPSAAAAAVPAIGIQLYRGANLVTWPGPDRESAAALGAHGATIGAVYSIDPATGQWLRYIPGASYANTLTTLRAGQPYWFIAGNDGWVAVAP